MKVDSILGPAIDTDPASRVQHTSIATATSPGEVVAQLIDKASAPPPPADQPEPRTPVPPIPEEGKGTNINTLA